CRSWRGGFIWGRAGDGAREGPGRAVFGARHTGSSRISPPRNTHMRIASLRIISILIISRLMTNQLPPAKNLGLLINEVSRLLRRRLDRDAQAIGLTSAQWRVLAYLV